MLTVFCNVHWPKATTTQHLVSLRLTCMLTLSRNVRRPDTTLTPPPDVLLLRSVCSQLSRNVHLPEATPTHLLRFFSAVRLFFFSVGCASLEAVSLARLPFRLSLHSCSLPMVFQTSVCFIILVFFPWSLILPVLSFVSLFLYSSISRRLV